MSDLSNIPTEQLLYELYDRMDDNMYALERKFDPYLDSIDRLEKQTLWQNLRLVYEDYTDDVDGDSAVRDSE
tara:strand:- start:270 stop:485 length:216 start_codon:yes stop_codon:yes gene_type:complete